MKLKQSPDDFLVEEQTDVLPGGSGNYAFYRLEKVNWTTPDALSLIRRRWKLSPRRLSYGGLKDRHARTTQYLSIYHGPNRNLSQEGISLTFLGYVPRPYGSEDIRANRFSVTLRDLDPLQRDAIDRRLIAVKELGVPNYFDDQRFGSVSGPGGEFIGRMLVQGRFEDALKQALAGHYPYDTAATRAEKQLLREHWGDWTTLKDRLPRGHARSLVDYLRVHPGDFKGAVIRLRPELRGLYLSAYQSHLWNRMLARWIERHTTPRTRRDVQQRLGPVPFPLHLSEPDLRAYQLLNLPLPSSRWKAAPDDPRLPLVEEILAEEGLTLRDMRIRGVRELYFSRGERPGRVEVMSLNATWADDDRHPRRLRLTLRFELERGSYATLVVKAVL
ncbi:MAG: tRNA pseudouridine(13) synthase TruD [Gemmataceae bacterium]